MERHLGDAADWFVGAAMTVADIALYAYTHVADEGGFDLADYPNGHRLARPRRRGAGACADAPPHRWGCKTARTPLKYDIFLYLRVNF